MEILDSNGSPVRTFSSADTLVTLDPKAITVDPRWARPPQVVSSAAGAHRFVWDLRTAGSTKGLGMAAIWQNTPISRGAFVQPGTYTVRLTVDGKAFQQQLELRADPRVK